MNSRALWLKELATCYNYLSMDTNSLQRAPWDFFSFSLGQYFSSPGPFAANVIAVYQGSHTQRISEMPV